VVVRRDLIGMLPAIEAAGALQAETMVMTNTIQLQAPTVADLRRRAEIRGGLPAQVPAQLDPRAPAAPKGPRCTTFLTRRWQS
jgi:hypothetical protein